LRHSFSIGFVHDAYETLAGLILFHAQRIPKVGDKFTINNVELTIKEMKGAKIEKIEVKRRDTPKAKLEAMRESGDVKAEEVQA